MHILYSEKNQKICRIIGHLEWALTYFFQFLNSNIAHRFLKYTMTFQFEIPALVQLNFICQIS
jgi:hypothetical protein